MNLQDLVYFHHLAQSLNFTATAEHFYISQPSISMALKRLENEMETTLIDRRRALKKMRLTPAGEILYRDANQVISILEKTKQSITDLKMETVYFGFLPTIGGYFLPKLLPQMKEFAQSLKLVEEESSDIMLQMVQKGEVPIAIVGSELSSFQDSRLKQIPLLSQELALWVSPSSPLAQKKVVEAEDIRDEMFISLSSGYTHQRIFEKWTKNHFIEEPNIVYAKEIRTVQSIAASTHMIGFMADILVADRTDLVKVVLKDAPMFYVSLIMNTKVDNTYFQEKFQQALLDTIAKESTESN